jgi:hypothetical protein
MPVRHTLILLAPFASAGAWFILLTILFRTMSPRFVPEPGSQPGTDSEDSDAPAQPFGKGWMRWIWFAYVLYHFPVVVPACWLSKDDTCPQWLALSLTAVLYSGVLFLLFFRP